MAVMSDEAYDVLVAINKATKAEARADKLMRRAFPIGCQVEVYQDVKATETIIGTLRHYTMPIGSLVIEFSPDDLAKVSQCWHLPRYPNYAEISWAKIKGKVA